MRFPADAARGALAATLVAAVTWLPAGCSIGGPGDPGRGASPSTGADDPGTEACAEVRKGIDAFNAGDFEKTVERFEAAVPLAEQRAEEYPSRRAELLLEAVRWYADLAPEDYPRASRESGKFARYKAITLAQCVVGVPGDVESSSGVDV